MIFAFLTTPAYASTDIPLYYHGSDDYWSGSGSNSVMAFYVEYSPTFLDNGQNIRAYHKFLNRTSGDKNFLYKVSYDPDNMRFDYYSNIKGCLCRFF